MGHLNLVNINLLSIEPLDCPKRIILRKNHLRLGILIEKCLRNFVLYQGEQLHNKFDIGMKELNDTHGIDYEVYIFTVL